MSQPQISRLLIWERHEHRVVEVVSAALAILQDKPDLLQSEVFLNRELYFCLLQANRSLWKSGLGGFDHPPTPEGYVQSMEFDDILVEVNATCNSKEISEIGIPIGGWKIKGISRVEHQLDRPFAYSPLHLSHFWLDLRKL